MTKETGGPAFPCKAYTGLMQEGLSIRDHFAGLAMQGLIASNSLYDGKYLVGVLAKDAYLCADAMLQERNKP